MAVFSSIFVPSDAAAIKIAALAASTASAEQVLNSNAIVAINADQDITITWGRSGMAAPTVSSFRLPANQTMMFDLGQNHDRLRVFNISSTAVNVYIKTFSRS